MTVSTQVKNCHFCWFLIFEPETYQPILIEQEQLFFLEKKFFGTEKVKKLILPTFLKGSTKDRNVSNVFFTKIRSYYTIILVIIALRNSTADFFPKRKLLKI